MQSAVAVGQGNWAGLTRQEVRMAEPIESSFRIVQVVEVQYDFLSFLSFQVAVHQWRLIPAESLPKWTVVEARDCSKLKANGSSRK